MSDGKHRLIDCSQANHCCCYFCLLASASRAVENSWMVHKYQKKGQVFQFHSFFKVHFHWIGLDWTCCRDKKAVSESVFQRELLLLCSRLVVGVFVLWPSFFIFPIFFSVMHFLWKISNIYLYLSHMLTIPLLLQLNPKMTETHFKSFAPAIFYLSNVTGISF